MYKKVVCISLSIVSVSFVLFLVHRILWVCVIMASFGTLTFVIVQNLIKYFSHPKVVNVDVVYEDELRFPAVTICNYNGVK